jgi:uncharacterized protein (TIGR03067 family)
MKRIALRLLAIVAGFALLQAHLSSAFPAEDDFKPRQSPLNVPAPKDAIVLFDGAGTNAAGQNLFLSKHGGKIDWPIEEGALVSTPADARANHIVSRLHFRDADLHVEFMVAEKGDGNSGVYLHGNYELQILNSFGKERPTMDDAGAVYGFSPPLVNAARKPGEWQVYDIRYRAPRRDAAGKIVQEGTITAWLNGQKVQDNAKVGEPRSQYHPFRYKTTPYLEEVARRQKSSMTGPVFLQDHDSPARFRNVWVRPLDDQAFLYEPVVSQEELIQKDRKQIAGTWRAIAVTVDGNKGGEEDVKKIVVVNGADGTWSLRVDGVEISQGTSSIDPSKKPKTIDFTPTQGEGKDQLHLGIYELGEKTRKLCFAPAGKQRPAEFSSTAGSEHILVEFERVEEKEK